MGMMAAVLSGFVLALGAPMVYRTAGRAAGWILAILPLSLTIYFASFLGTIATGQTIHARVDWVPALGVSLSFTLDGLSLLFALLISGVGALVLIYAGGYLAGHAQLGRLYAFLLMFMASMLGLVLADNLLLLFVFWELTSLSSYLLIGFDHERAEARASALQALLVTGGGGLALLAGFVLLGQVSGSLELSALAGGLHEVRVHPLYVPILLLVLGGAFTKSAQFPFHFWLPAAMEAPTPVSAYLHSATMVKAGVYLLARLMPVLGETNVWLWTVTGVGLLTMLVGGFLALRQADLKLVLAYSTVSTLGMLTALLGLGGELAVRAALAYLVAHALYKGALFLVVGSLDHQTGTRDVNKLSGLARAMPITALAGILAALSMAGIPPLFGFVSKELFYEATLHAPAAAGITAAAVLANTLLVAAAGIVGVRPFVGKASPSLASTREASPDLWLGPTLLAGLGVALALWPGVGVEALLASAGSVVLGQPVEGRLALWHGLTPTLALSAITLVAGVGIYAASGRVRRLATRWEEVARWGPAGGYELSLRSLDRLAFLQTQGLQSGYLRHYLMITLATMVGLTGYALLSGGATVGALNWFDVRFYEIGLVGLLLLAVLAVVLTEARLAAIAALSVVGYAVALIFVLFGAPDLATTQFLVETLTVILFVLVFYHLPESKIVSGIPARVRDVVLAVGVGAVMTALVLVATPDNYPPISGYFAEHSVPEGHGRNIVNVILVDFRGLDTLGEITVLTMAAIGVFALLKLRGTASKEADASKPSAGLDTDPLDDIGATREGQSDQRSPLANQEAGKAKEMAAPSLVSREGDDQ